MRKGYFRPYEPDKDKIKDWYPDSKNDIPTDEDNMMGWLEFELDFGTAVDVMSVGGHKLNVKKYGSEWLKTAKGRRSEEIVKKIRNNSKVYCKIASMMVGQPFERKSQALEMFQIMRKEYESSPAYNNLRVDGPAKNHNYVPTIPKMPTGERFVRARYMSEDYRAKHHES